MLDTVIVAIYFIAMLGAGWIGLRKASTPDAYLVAGRRLGFPMYAGTLSAVVLGGASTIGGVRLGYVHGISGMWLVAMLGLGIIVLSLGLAPRLSASGLYSVAEILGNRYGVAPRVVGGSVMALYDLMVAVTASIAIGSIFAVMLDAPRTWAIVGGTAVVVAYSALGGMWSITLTDIAQFLIMTGGMFLLLLPASVHRAGGIGALHDRLPASYFDVTAIGGDTILTYFLIYFFGILIGQDIWQRVFTARNAKVATWAGVFSGCYCLLYAVCGAVIGMAARVVLPNISDPDTTFALLTRTVLPAGVSGLVIAAASAAVMSTASACLLAASTLLSRDIIPGAGESVRRERMFTVGTGVLVIVVALLVQDVVAGLTIAYNVLVGGLFVTIVGGLLWKRATAAGAIASMLVGSGTVIALMVVRGMLANEPIYIGLVASLVAFVVVSLVTPQRPTQAEASDTP